MKPELQSYLEKHRIEYTEYEHPAVFTVAESDKVTKHIPGARTKNLFLKDEKGNFYLICLLGHKRLNLKFLKSYLNAKKLQFGSPEELKTELDLTPGSVSILGMINSSKTHLIIDKSIYDALLIGAHPNINTSTLVFDNSSLKKFLASLKCKIEVINIE